MKNKHISTFLSVVLFIFMLAFFAFTHVVASVNGGLAPLLTTLFGDLWTRLITPDLTVAYISAITIALITLVLVVVWVIRLLVHRRNALNLFSPLLFLVAVVIGFLIIEGRLQLESFFAVPTTQVATGYLLLTGFIVIALALHLMVIGISTASHTNKESLLKEVFVEEKEEFVEETAEEPKLVEEANENTTSGETVCDEHQIRVIVREVLKEELKETKVVVKEEKTPVEKKPTTPVKVAKEKKAVSVPVEEGEEKETAARIPFAERMLLVEEKVQKDYNELKNYILSFGLKSRVSNSGDSFRLGRKLYAKLTNSGNSGLKLYLPIDPADYEDSKIPFKDASNIKQYEDVPTFIYIKSDLSMKRAQKLLDDLMLKEGITRKFDHGVEDFIQDFSKEN